MRLSELAALVGGTLTGGDPDVLGVAVDSRLVRAGDLFVAVRGLQADGAAFAPDAVARGAVAVCAEPRVAGLPALPTLVVPDARRALAPLAAAAHGHPARRLALVGITGTLGKTSTALLVEAALGGRGAGAAPPVGVIGSLGVRLGGVRVDGAAGTAAMTTPDAPALHAAFRRIADAGARVAVMEVTSHALAQGRVAGLEFALGVFTNLVPDEHLEFHATPDDYVRTKLRFLDQLAPHAPLVVDHDDALVRTSTASLGARVVGVSAAGAPDADAVVEQLRADAAGSAFVVRLTREVAGMAGRRVGPLALPLRLPVFGDAHVANAALAAVAALLAGAEPAAVTGAVAEVRPIRRRMEVLRSAGPFVLDDTSGNPRTVDGLFRSLRHVPHDALRVLFGVRGSRGRAINRGLAEALARSVGAAAGRRPVRLVVTASGGAAGPRDLVRPDERDAVLEALAAAGVPHEYEPALEPAVGRALDGWGPRDAVLLLGAQGMDRAGEVAMRVLGA